MNCNCIDCNLLSCNKHLHMKIWMLELLVPYHKEIDYWKKPEYIDFGLQLWWCVHIMSCGGFSQSLSPTEDRLWSWCCCLSTHVQFRFSSFSSRTINKLPICTKPLTQKNIHSNTKLYKRPQSHLFTAGLCYIFFSIVINDYVQGGCVRISCSAKGCGQIPNRFCSRISFEELNGSLLILCR